MATIEVKVDRVIYAVIFCVVLSILVYQTVVYVGHRESRESDGVDEYIVDIPQFDSRKLPAIQPEVVCETFVQQPLAAVNEYTKLTKTDALGGDLFALNTKKIDELRRVCDSLDLCHGFNTNGWLKKRTDKKYKTSTDLYIKQAQSPDEEIYLSAHVIEDNYGRDYLNMMSKIRVYMYPTSLDAGIRSWPDYKYGVEQLFIDLLRESSFITQDPEEATFFLLPFRCTAYRKTVADRDKAQVVTEDLVNKIHTEIKTNYPYWNRTLGADHFYICAHDMGASSIGSADPNLLKNAIALVNTADYSEQYYIPHKDISLPPHPAHGEDSLPSRGRGGHGIPALNRTVLAFFAGTLNRGRVRPRVQQLWSKDSDFRVFMGFMSDDKYQHYLQTSQYCLILRGNRAWTPRIMDAVWFGCIPVIISDYYDLPFQGLIDWNKFSVIVRESQVDKLKEILKSIPPAQVTKMQANLRHVYGHFTWNDPPRPYDAFHTVLYQLWRRRGVIRYKL